MDEAHEASASKGNYAPVYVGALPVHTVAGGGANVNKPILLTDFASAVKAVGYTDDWANYDLCEALYTHFVLAENGPIVVINVFNPATKKKNKETTVQATANQAILGDMGNVILDSFTVTGKTRTWIIPFAYDYVSERIILRGLRKGALEGSLSITYDEVTPGIEAADVIGDTDNEGHKQRIVPHPPRLSGDGQNSYAAALPWFFRTFPPSMRRWRRSATRSAAISTYSCSRTCRFRTMRAKHSSRPA